MSAVRALVEARFPGLHARIEAALIDAEARYCMAQGQQPSAFLLEHTRRTAAIALKLAQMERVEPLLPVLVALFHDAGKFDQGVYHGDALAEEEHAAVLALAMLADLGAEAGLAGAVAEALRALYDDQRPCGPVAAIVQDADRLEKLGPLGVGAFFTKATLRGQGMVEALARGLSRELTYARAASRSMFTASGRSLAAERGAKTEAYFDDLLRDLDTWGIAAFERRDLVLEGEFRSRSGLRVAQMEVSIVAPRHCPACGGGFGVTHARERGVKCEKLTARLKCTDCGAAREIYFCLPVLA